MGTWEEAKHPRSKNGEFGHKDWVGKLDEKIGKDLGAIATKPKAKRAAAPKAPAKGKAVAKIAPTDEMIDVGRPEADAINAYTGGGFRDMNGYLRSGKTRDYMTAEEAKAAIAGLDTVFERMPTNKRPYQVHCGVINPDDVFGPVGSKDGKVFKDKGYVSTTWHAKERYGTAKGAKTLGKADITIHVPVGSKGFQPNEFGAFGDSEGEVLLPRGSRFKIVSDVMGDDEVRYMEMELLA